MASSTELTPQCLLSLTLHVLYLTIPQELCRCEAKGVHGFTELISTHSEKKSEFSFHPLFAISNAFNISIFGRKFSCFLRGVGLGVKCVHHCQQEVKGEMFGIWRLFPTSCSFLGLTAGPVTSPCFFLTGLLL